MKGNPIAMVNRRLIAHGQQRRYFADIPDFLDPRHGFDQRLGLLLGPSDGGKYSSTPTFIISVAGRTAERQFVAFWLLDDK